MKGEESNYSGVEKMTQEERDKLDKALAEKKREEQIEGCTKGAMIGGAIGLITPFGYRPANVAGGATIGCMIGAGTPRIDKLFISEEGKKTIKEMADSVEEDMNPNSGLPQYNRKFIIDR